MKFRVEPEEPTSIRPAPNFASKSSPMAVERALVFSSAVAESSVALSPTCFFSADSSLDFRSLKLNVFTAPSKVTVNFLSFVLSAQLFQSMSSLALFTAPLKALTEYRAALARDATPLTCTWLVLFPAANTLPALVPWASVEMAEVKKLSL